MEVLKKYADNELRAKWDDGLGKYERKVEKPLTFGDPDEPWTNLCIQPRAYQRGIGEKSLLEEELGAGGRAALEGKIRNLEITERSPRAAVGMRYLRPPRAAVATLLGTGAQSTWHALAMHQELELEELRLCGRTPEAVERLAGWARDRGIPAVSFDQGDHAVRGSDVVVTVMSSYEPLFAGAALEPHALVCAVGATNADRREIDAETVRRAELIVTDGVPGSKVEAGDLISATREGALDWDAVVDMEDVAGTVGRSPGTGVVLFESQGIALQDVATAALAYERHLGGVEPEPSA